MKLRVCFEIDGLAEDEHGNPALAGLARPCFAIERARELAQAEKDGRLVVLPCKVGDLLYEVDLPEYGVIVCKVLHVGTHNGPMSHVPGGLIWLKGEGRQ